MIVDDFTVVAAMDAEAPAPPAGFGIELVLNLAGCDPAIINDPAAIQAWALELCERINMIAHGEPFVHHFGEGNLAGWSVIQPITTSDIKVHAVDVDRSAFINVFSCRAFDTEEATRFTVARFAARAYEVTVLQRRAPTFAEES